MLYRNNSVFTLCGEQHSSLCSHCESDVCYCLHTVTVTFVVAFTLWQWCSLLHSHCVESNVRRCVHTLRVTFVVLFTLCGKRRFSLCSHCDSDVRHCVHTMTVTLVVVFTCESDVRRCVHNVWRATFLVVFTLWERRSSLCSHCVESDVPRCVHTVRVTFIVVFTLWQWRWSLCLRVTAMFVVVFTLCGERRSSLCSHCESDVRCCVHTMTVTLVVVFTCESDVHRCVHTVWRATFLLVFTLWERCSSLYSHCDSHVRHCVHTVRVTFVVVFTLWERCSSLCSHCESDVHRCVHTMRAMFVVVFTLWERCLSLCSHCESDVRRCVHTMRAMFVVVFTLWEWRSSLCSHTVWRVKFLVVFTLWEWRSLFLSYTYFWKHVWLGNPGINISVSCHVHTVLPFLYIFHQYCGISETVATSSVDLCSNVTGSDRICGEASYIACWFNEAPSLPVDLMRPHTLPVDLMRPHTVPVDLMRPHTVPVDLMRPHTVPVDLMRPHTLPVDLMRPHTLPVDLMRPHTVPVDLMRPHTLPVAWTTSRSYCRQSHSNSPRSLLQETFVSLFLDEPKVLADEIETESIASPIVLLRVLLLCVSCAACQAEGVRRDIVECCKFRDSVIRRFTCRLVEYLWSVSDLYVAMMISMLPFIAFTFCLWLVEIHADIMR